MAPETTDVNEIAPEDLERAGECMQVVERIVALLNEHNVQPHEGVRMVAMLAVSLAGSVPVERRWVLRSAMVTMIMESALQQDARKVHPEPRAMQ